MTLPAPSTTDKRPGSALNSKAKRFTVRDGFHLKDRNDDKRAAIDQQILPPGPPPEDLPLKSDDVRTEEPATTGDGDIGRIFDFMHRPVPPLRPYANQSGAVATTITLESVAPPPPNHHRKHRILRAPGTEANDSSLRSAYTPAESKAIASRLEPSSEWLIYRQRGNNQAQRRNEEQMEQLLNELVPRPAPLPSPSPLPSRPPNGARLVKQLTCRERAGQRRDLIPLPSNITPKSAPDVLANVVRTPTTPHHPTSLSAMARTETERALVSSREANTRDVNRLLMSILQPPPVDPSEISTSDLASADTPTSRRPESLGSARPKRARSPGAEHRFSTQRSVLRLQTAQALKGRKLLSRMDELRTLPQVVTQVLHMQRAQRQARIREHGEDIVQRNKHVVQPLHRSGETALFPSLIDQRHERAIRRKQQMDAQQELAVRNAVDRWQRRREEHLAQQQRIYHQSQWLMIIALTRCTRALMDKFINFKRKRDTPCQLTMAKKIQRYWRLRVLLKRSDSLAALALVPPSAKSTFYRMPIVMKAIHLLQKRMRTWLTARRTKQAELAIEVILTSWLEFQDVKFRRLILRFRKRVREFQTMWRSWRAVTEGRIKLLLLLWNKVEKKAKRRGGVQQSLAAAAQAASNHSTNTSHSILVPSLSPAERHHKRLEGVHRHLKNGGAVLTPLTATANGANADKAAAGSPSPKKMKLPSKARESLELQSHIEDELMYAMQEFYVSNHLPHSLHGHVHSTSPSKHSPQRGSIAAVPLKSNSPLALHNLPWKAPAAAPAPVERVPLAIKVMLLRQLLSEKRKMFRILKDKRREEWQETRQAMRRVEFRYNVLDEVAAFQKFRAETSMLLLLRSVTETEMLQLIQLGYQQAQQQTAAALQSVELSAIRPYALMEELDVSSGFSFHDVRRRERGFTLVPSETASIAPIIELIESELETGRLVHIIKHVHNVWWLAP
ncbi:TPA: hypothetical protein N0F65_009191 [Lagenidium giganteum]|uniref:Sfi1 spindle body domain-containing protein n=1 Tax=Lagenidium giganteum TaxID=4803 RepID=A0AAV2YLC4_9STRA|nr:TPA: hypothetical protein N0F65_009191 [Lagenidium giganteum]